MSRLACLAGVVLPLLLSAAVLADDQKQEGVRPLDARMRCIVLFRETMVLISHQDVKRVLANVADGVGESKYRIFSDGLPHGGLEGEVKDPAQFFKHNFRHADVMHDKFNEMRFGDLGSKTQTVTIIDGKADSQREVKLHEIPVTIPGIDDRKFSPLRFIEVDGHLYWIPFGW